MLSKNIAWLLQEMDSFRQHRRYRQTLLETTEMIVDIVDPKIRLAHGYRKALLPSVEAAMKYCQELVASIPGPVRLGQDSYYYDPLVKILFPSIDEMEMILRLAQDKEHSHFKSKEIVALLTMIRTEKTIFSYQLQGELFLRDVAMRTVNFNEHRIVAPSDDLQTARTQLKQRSLEVLATMAKQKITSLQTNIIELREHRERIAFMIRVLGGRSRTFQQSAHFGPEKTYKVKELEQMLAVIEKKIELAKNELYPENILNNLKQIISTPEYLLSPCQYSLNVNWMNVLVEINEQDEYTRIAFVEVAFDKDMQSRSSILVNFDRLEIESEEK